MDYWFNNTGSGDTDWNNLNNWWNDSGFTSPVGSVPSFTDSDTVTVDSNLDTNIPTTLIMTVYNNAIISLITTSITANAYILNNGTILLDNASNLYISGTLDNYGNINNFGTIDFLSDFNNYSGGTLDNYGYVSNTYSFNNYGFFINENTGTGTNNGGTLNNSYIMLNYGLLVSTYIINNTGTLNSVGIILNKGQFIQNGSFLDSNVFINFYNFYNSGAGDTNWNNTSNWFYDDASLLPIGAVPTILATDEVNIKSECDNIVTNIYFTLNILAGEMNFNNYINNTGTIALYNTCAITNVNYLDNKGTMLIMDHATLTNNSVVANMGTLEVHSYGTYDTSSGTYNNTGIFNVYDNAYIVINQSTYVGNYFNSGAGSSWTDYHSWYYDNTHIVVTPSTDFQTTDTLILNSISYTNIPSFYFNVINNGTLVVSTDGHFIYQSVINNGSIILSASCTNNGTVTNFGTITNNSLFVNNGNLSMTPDSQFINNGTFMYGNKYTTNFKGEIYPQIPSSASWGNVFL